MCDTANTRIEILAVDETTRLICMADKSFLLWGSRGIERCPSASGSTGKEMLYERIPVRQ